MVKECISIKETWYKILFDRKLITEKNYYEKVKEILELPCYEFSASQKKSMKIAQQDLEKLRVRLESGELTRQQWKKIASQLARFHPSR